ncbi:Zn-dependent M28 family amino/carboxypeptidase [Rhodopirellula rubra]|uniref:Zn-dependent M28 family amino/carboxypeptidase n=1 Tax=Aporhodopirellula rubra TaxID=980271 RepID=A0A7W5DZ81_9BACT|nr:M28 family peptidase [Aporhodopirellula rubra]MBB3206372.1 Zn-dependent M28 family amino/carboxypeptidase [Aporhodopirellula rubra]
MNENREQIEANLRLHVDRLAGLIGPRTLQKPKTILATIGYLEAQWHEMGYHVERETYDAMGDEATNLIVQKKGGTRANQIVLLGAHYDTVFSTPGADDNASAVAVLLEVSRLLREHSGKRTARYVSFACEEPPYFNVDSMGSQHHARESRVRGDDIVGMLCLEMVGYYQLTQGSQLVPDAIPKMLHRFFPRRGNFLAAVGNLRSWNLCWKFRRGFRRGTRRLPLFSIVLPEKINEIRLSDNSSFWDQGYPALMLTDTSFLRNPHYHRSTDTPETLDYPRMTEVTLGVAAAMKKLLR